MLVSDSFLRQYYRVSYFFLAFSALEAILFAVGHVSYLNFVYLLFEVVWMFYSFLMVWYVLTHKHPRQLVFFPVWYFLYFFVSAVFSWRMLQGENILDKEYFVRNNAVIIGVFVFVGFVGIRGIWRKFFKAVV